MTRLFVFLLICVTCVLAQSDYYNATVLITSKNYTVFEKAGIFFTWKY